MATGEAYRNFGLFRIPMPLAAGMAAAFMVAFSAMARAATITVTTLSDPTGLSGTCSLRDAITAANTKTATNGCAAGTGNDTIQFSVTGTIALVDTLPQITDAHLTINRPASPGITLDGGDKVRVMIVQLGATVNINNLTITHGSTPGNIGSGIYNNGGTLTVTHSTFSANQVAYAGGDMVNVGGMLTVTNSTFVQDGQGGIVNYGGTLTVTNSTFSVNRALMHAAVSNVLEGTLTVSNSTFSGKGAGAGGGIFSNGGALTVTNSTFSGYSVGIDNFTIGQTHGTVSVTNSTFSANNTAIHSDPGLVTSIKSTNLASSSGGNCFGSITDAGYNISDDSSCGFNATGSHNNTDPELNPAGFANNGGPTQTIALLPGSPAIDAIPLANCNDQASPPNPIITDQRGFPRPDAGEANCDIGAYEVQDASFVPFAGFGGGLTLHPGAGLFYLSGGFKLGPGGSIDPATEPVAFGVGDYALRLPAGSFVKNNTGYVYQKTVNGIFLFVYIKFTGTPGIYRLLVERKGGALPTNPALVTLTIGNDSGSTFFK
jgi:CSLREA domain-containing protein